jgi:hypothetical protein
MTLLAEAATRRNDEYFLTTKPLPGRARREFLLCELRRMSARARLAANECDSIGTALKGGLIEPEAALEWLDELDPQLFDLLGAPAVPA